MFLEKRFGVCMGEGPRVGFGMTLQWEDDSSFVYLVLFSMCVTSRLLMLFKGLRSLFLFFSEG